MQVSLFGKTMKIKIMKVKRTTRLMPNLIKP